MAAGERWVVNQEEIMQQLQAAVVLHNQGELDHAEAIYRKVLAVDANNFYALNFCGCVLRSKGQLEDACLLLQRAVSISPGEIGAQYNLGNVFRDLTRHAEALSHYTAALDVNPSDSLVLYEFAKSCKILGDSARAISGYRKAIEVKPDFAKAYLNLGNILKEEGDVEEAIASYRKAIEVKPDFADAYVNLGIVLKEEGEVEEAIASYRKAIELKPDFADVYFALGLAMKEKGEVEEAIASYRKAIEVKPDFADAYKQLATCLHEESELQDALISYALALELDNQVSDSGFHLFAAGVEGLGDCFQVLKSEFARLSQRTEDLIQEDLLFLRCISVFSSFYGMSLEYSIEFLQVCDPVELAPRHSPALREIFKVYLLYRKLLLPRWMHFKNIPAPLLLLSDYLEFLRVKGNSLAEGWKALKNYQLSLASLDSESLPSPSQLFVKVENLDESLWLASERFQFPDITAALSLRESLLKKSSLPAASRQYQSEFFRKAHLLDAQKFYIAEEDPCLHGVSELYRVHGLIVDTIREMEGLQSVVDLGYYSCGIFNAGLNSELKCYCIEPARHHAVWVAESGIAEVVPDVPERCVRSFEEYLSRLEAVALDDSGSTAAVISFILQLFEYEQCVEILQRVKGFASHLVITDDILNEKSEESILRLLSVGKRMNLCHNYQQLLSDAGWVIEKKWYFHGVRYASGIIVASAV